MSSELRAPVTYAFVDAANIIYRDSELNPWKIDMQKLIKYLRERFGVSKTLYFGGIDERNKRQIRLYKKFRSWGYDLQLNPVKRFVNDRGEPFIKADVDSRMTFEMMKNLTEYDRAVVLTGDGDFYWVLECLLQEKEKVWLLTSPSKTARELKRLFGSNFSNLDNLRVQLELKTRKGYEVPEQLLVMSNKTITTLRRLLSNAGVQK